MFVASILAILHKVASLRFQYASVYITRKFASTAAWMRAVDLVTTIIAILNAVALLYRTNVTTAVFTAYRVVGTTLIRG
jgi:hypothetical protein